MISYLLNRVLHLKNVEIIFLKLQTKMFDFADKLKIRVFHLIKNNYQ